ncbi:MAG: hypothetical protein IJT50_02815 [Lentisphaeria bacterium]|nr:hypothetical protein [Lentisphaeria bacterium]
MSTDGEMKKDFSKEEIVTIAKYQAFVLYGVAAVLVASLLLRVSVPALILPARGLYLLCSLFCVYSVFCLRQAERENIVLTIVAMILLFIPLLNLVILVFTVVSATKILKAAGLNVGFMGVSKEEIERYKAQ